MLLAEWTSTDGVHFSTAERSNYAAHAIVVMPDEKGVRVDRFNSIRAFVRVGESSRFARAADMPDYRLPDRKYRLAHCGRILKPLKQKVDECFLRQSTLAEMGSFRRGACAASFASGVVRRCSELHGTAKVPAPVLQCR